MLFVSFLISKLHYILLLHTMRASRLVEGKTSEIQSSVPFLAGRLSQYFALRLRSVRSCKSNRHACCRECTPCTGFIGPIILGFFDEEYDPSFQRRVQTIMVLEYLFNNLIHLFGTCRNMLTESSGQGHPYDVLTLSLRPWQ